MKVLRDDAGEIEIELGDDDDDGLDYNAALREAKISNDIEKGAFIDDLAEEEIVVESEDEDSIESEDEYFPEDDEDFDE